MIPDHDCKITHTGCRMMPINCRVEGSRHTIFCLTARVKRYLVLIH